MSLLSDRPLAGKRLHLRMQSMSHNGKNGSSEPIPRVDTAHNGNGHAQPFSLGDPAGGRVNPKKFRGWKPQIGILEKYIARLVPDDPRRDELIEIALLMKHCDQLTRMLIAEFVARTIVDSPEHALLIRRKAGFLRPVA
jgi:hypothetical protein